MEAPSEPGDQGWQAVSTRRKRSRKGPLEAAPRAAEETCGDRTTNTVENANTDTQHSIAESLVSSQAADAHEAEPESSDTTHQTADGAASGAHPASIHRLDRERPKTATPSVSRETQPSATLQRSRSDVESAGTQVEIEIQILHKKTFACKHANVCRFVTSISQSAWSFSNKLSVSVPACGLLGSMYTCTARRGCLASACHDPSLT